MYTINHFPHMEVIQNEMKIGWMESGGVLVLHVLELRVDFRGGPNMNKVWGVARNKS